MKTTYLIENSQKEVFGYFTQLCEAKRTLERINNTDYRILYLKGQDFGKGYHAYEVVFTKNALGRSVFKRNKIR